MISTAEQFAERCISALKGQITAETGVLSLDAMRPVIAGSYAAFQLMLQQQDMRGTSRRQPDNLIEVQAYAAELGAKFDPLDFWDFYAERGWVVGKNIPMKDWKCTMRRAVRQGWTFGIKNSPGQNGPVHASLGALQVQLEKVNEEIRDIVRPGGSAHARTASSLSPEEVDRYNKLHALKVSLRNRIESV